MIVTPGTRHGGYYPPLRVDELFELTARERPDDVAVTFLEQRVPYGLLCTSDAGACYAIAESWASSQERWSASVWIAPWKWSPPCWPPSKPAPPIFRSIQHFPPDRIEFMLQDARPLVVLTQSHLVETSSPSAQPMCFVSMERCRRWRCEPACGGFHRHEIQVWMMSRTYFTRRDPRVNPRACRLRHRAP